MLYRRVSLIVIMPDLKANVDPHVWLFVARENSQQPREADPVSARHHHVVCWPGSLYAGAGPS